ncbi:MAG: AraC family transcriptional regulator [Desulfobulbales bacterium]
MSATYLLSPADILWKTLEAYGLDPEPIFLVEDITREMIMKPGTRISYKKSQNLWGKLSNLIKDPCFGLRAGQYWHPSHFNALGFAWLASVTLREALTRLVRYVHMISESTKIHLVENPAGLSVVYSDTMELPAYMDFSMIILSEACRLNFGNGFKPVAINFIHSEPSCAGDYVRFFNAPVTFNANDDRFIISSSDADKRLPTGNKNLASLHDQYILRYLDRMNDLNLAQQVKTAFLDLMPAGHISVKRVARRLNMTARSLQRRLRAEGTTFSKLVDEARRELAEDYIHDPSFSLMEVAFILGFSDFSSFSRAYKRWTGISPSKVRK